ncbi:MAG: hypothetical protein WKF97_23665 [Chitinophagaceae bacterium]
MQEYVLGKKGTGYIIFCESGKLTIDLPDDKTNYNLKWINPSTGEVLRSKKKVSGGRLNAFITPFGSPVVAWLVRDH